MRKNFVKFFDSLELPDFGLRVGSQMLERQGLGGKFLKARELDLDIVAMIDHFASRLET